MISKILEGLSVVNAAVRRQVPELVIGPGQVGKELLANGRALFQSRLVLWISAQAAEKEHHRLVRLEKEYQTTCTQSTTVDLTSEEEIKKMSAKIDLAFSVQLNIAVQVNA